MSRVNRPLEGLVASLVSDRELIINLGSVHGVEHGMRFSVLAKKPIEVTDPATNEKLGTFEQEKVRVQATQVFELMTVCKTYTYRMVGGSPLTDMIALTTQFNRPRRKVFASLRASEDSLPAPLEAEDSYVEIGDRVRLIVEVAEEEEED